MQEVNLTHQNTKTTLYNAMGEYVDPSSSKNEISIPHSTLEDETVFPPPNYTMVEEGIYRSGYFMQRNFSFLRRLKLKSVLFLCQEPYSSINSAYLEEEGIQLLQVKIESTKGPFTTMSSDKFRTAVSLLLDKRNHPILVHCNKGKHRSGCLIACLRKIQGWAIASLLEEYRRMSFPKARTEDMLFIEQFQPPKLNPTFLPSFVQQSCLPKRYFCTPQPLMSADLLDDDLELFDEIDEVSKTR
ncbi:hypothetical protein PCE1_001769 [Barthelona sp. PCE]